MGVGIAVPPYRLSIPKDGGVKENKREQLEGLLSRGLPEPERHPEPGERVTEGETKTGIVKRASGGGEKNQ